jgi:hypothetical protein
MPSAGCTGLLIEPNAALKETADDITWENILRMPESGRLRLSDFHDFVALVEKWIKDHPDSQQTGFTQT